MAIRLTRPAFGPNPRTRLVHYDRDLARYDVPTTPAIDDARADVDRIEALADATLSRAELVQNMRSAIVRGDNISQKMKADVAAADDVEKAIRAAYGDAWDLLLAAYKHSADDLFTGWQDVFAERLDDLTDAMARLRPGDRDATALVKDGRTEAAEAFVNLGPLLHDIAEIRRLAYVPFGVVTDTGAFNTLADPGVTDGAIPTSPVDWITGWHRFGARPVLRHPREARRMERERREAAMAEAAKKRPIGGSMSGRTTMRVFGAPIRG